MKMLRKRAKHLEGNHGQNDSGRYEKLWNKFTAGKILTLYPPTAPKRTWLCSPERVYEINKTCANRLRWNAGKPPLDYRPFVCQHGVE